MCLQARTELAPRERLFRLFEDTVHGPALKQFSGWDCPLVGNTFGDIDVHLTSEDLLRYAFDHEIPHVAIESAKESVAQHISTRENTQVSPDDLLLVPGATAALSIAAHLVKKLGHSVLITDPPFYFSTNKICDIIGLPFLAVPRSVEDLNDFDALISTIERCKQKKAVLLTQPRYVVSRSYPPEVLLAIRQRLSREDLLILDQSADIELQGDLLDTNDPRIIRIKTLGKILSINGARLAVIVARSNLLMECHRIAGALFGSLDVAMLRLGVQLIKNQEMFNYQRGAVRRLVEESFLRTRTSLAGAQTSVPKPENGFLSYILVHFPRGGRYLFYQTLLRGRVHAMFGVHLGLKQSYTVDLIRVNYLLNLEPALRIICQALPCR